MMHPTDLSSAAAGIGVLVFEAEGLGFAVLDVWVLQYPYSRVVCSQPSPPTLSIHESNIDTVTPKTTARKLNKNPTWLGSLSTSVLDM